MGSLKNAFTKAHGAWSKVYTVGGALFLGFVFGAAGAVALKAAAAGTVATNGAVLGSFHMPLIADPVTGNFSVAHLGTGVKAWFSSFFNVTAAGGGALLSGQPVGAAVQAAWAAPIAA
jgi:hypothetical protein